MWAPKSSHQTPFWLGQQPGPHPCGRCSSPSGGFLRRASRCPSAAASIGGAAPSPPSRGSEIEHRRCGSSPSGGFLRRAPRDQIHGRQGLRAHRLLPFAPPCHGAWPLLLHLGMRKLERAPPAMASATSPLRRRPLLRRRRVRAGPLLPSGPPCGPPSTPPCGLGPLCLAARARPPQPCRHRRVLVLHASWYVGWISGEEDRFDPMTSGPLMSLSTNMDLGAFVWGYC